MTIMLFIHNLPPSFDYKDILNLIENKCGIHSVILDNLIADNQSSRVSVGVSDEDQAAIIIKYLSGTMVNGYQLHVKDVGMKSVSQHYRNTQDQSKHPCNDFGHSSSDMQSSDDAPMPLLIPEPIPTKPTFKEMDIYNQQSDQARLVNQPNDKLHLQHPIPEIVHQPNAYNQGKVPDMTHQPNVYNQDVPEMVHQPNVYNQGDVPEIAHQPNVYNQDVPEMVHQPNVYNQGDVPEMAHQPNVYNQDVPEMVHQPNVYNQGMVPEIVHQPNAYNQGNVSDMTHQPNVCNQDVPEMVTYPNAQLCTQISSEIINGLPLNLDEEPEEYRKIFMRILNKVIKYRVSVISNGIPTKTKEEIIVAYNEKFSVGNVISEYLKKIGSQAKFEYNMKCLGLTEDFIMPMATKTNNITLKSSSEWIAMQNTLQDILMRLGKLSTNKTIMIKSMGLSYFIAAEMSYIERAKIDIQKVVKEDTLSPFLAIVNPFNVVEVRNNVYPSHAELEAYLKPFNVLGMRKFWIKNTYMVALKTFTDARTLCGLKCITVDNKKLIITEFVPQANVATKSKRVTVRYFPRQSSLKLNFDQRSTLNHHSYLLSIEVNKHIRNHVYANVTSMGTKD